MRQASQKWEACYYTTTYGLSMRYFVYLTTLNSTNKLMDLDHEIRSKMLEIRKGLTSNILGQSVEVSKARPSMPIGTVSNGRKKVAEGKWVEISDPKTSKSKKDKSAKKGPNIDPIFLELNKKHELSRLPIGIDTDKVTINDGSVAGNWILKWTDPKTNRAVTAYSKAFLKKNADNKWKRIQNVSSKDIEQIKTSSVDLLQSKDDNESQCGAIVAIISKTGLRPGSRSGFKRTENRGVSTLAKKNVRVKGDLIMFEFKGKSYKNNTAVIKSKQLAQYLSNRVKDMQDEDFIFNVDISKARDVFQQQISPKQSIKLKDMRTYIATDMARSILFDDKSTPPPLPDKGVKKAIQDKLKEVFEKVSSQLNNSPTMAKTSYVHPNVINEWLDSLGVKEADMFMMKASIFQQYIDTIEIELGKGLSYADKIEAIKNRLDPEGIENDFEDIDEYALPDWWDHTLD